MKKIIAVGVAAALALCASAEVKTATPFADGMVLQRGRSVPVWGTAAPGEAVTVSFAGQTKTTAAGADGKWRVDLDAMEASRENRTMTVAGAANTEEIKDVLVGEVWFASGQSNMQCPIWGDNPRYRDGQGAVMTRMTRRPFIRYSKTPCKWSAEPLVNWKAQWRDFSPAALAHQPLSAVAFYYALEIYDALEIPVGIIDSSWGGTCIQTWTPRAGLQKYPSLKVYAERKVETDKEKAGKSPHQQPTALWNGMVAAYAPFALRGMIWYQGCSNKDHGSLYCDMMHALYDGWSAAFENDAMRLYFAQLAPFKNDFHRVRMAQVRFAAEEPNAALAVICDVGNLADIHPNDKETVARRLALHALKRDYGFDEIIDNSPALESGRVEDGKFVLSFSNASGWYIYRPDRTTDNLGFDIAGLDGKFVPAKLLNAVDNKGNVKGRELIVAADGVDNPRQLRYLATSPWTGAIYSCDSGLPLGCFEIDARTVETVRKENADAAAADALIAGFRKVLVAEIPVGKSINTTGYSLDSAAQAGAFSRVAYKMELVRKDGTIDWVVAAMDAFTDDAAKLGVPSLGGGKFQQKVSGLVVRSNVAGLEDRDGGEGAIEFFNSNYNPRMGAKDWAGDDAKYDINDTAQGAGGGYGSMQLHDLASGKSVFAYNAFNGSDPDIGIGPNDLGQHPDWTFAHNAALYKSRTLTVFVK